MIENIRTIYRKHWLVGFCIGIFAVAIIALQFTPFSISAQSERGIFGFLDSINMAHAEGGGDDGGGDSGGGDDGGGGDCCGGGDDGGSDGGDNGGGDCCGGGDDGGDDGGGDSGGDSGGESNPPPPPLAPVCTMTASVSSVVRGQSVTISWTSSNATSATLSGVGAVAVSGSITFTPQTDTTYVLTVVGAGGQVVCQTTVRVTSPPPPPPLLPICTLTISPTSIVLGQSATLTWSSSNAMSASLSGVGAVGLSGSIIVTPNTNTTYVLTVTNSAGQTATCQANIQVTQPPSVPVCTLTATPTTITPGQSVTIAWTSSNATSATLSGVGSVALSGSRVFTYQFDTTIVLTVIGPGGQAICQATVRVTPPPPPLPVCTLTISPTSIIVGQSATLTWSSSNAVSATLSGVGSVGTSGSLTVSPASNTTYVLTVTNSSGQTATCQASIQVTQPPPPSLPVCTLTVSPTLIMVGQTATLSWTSSNAVSATLTGFGAVGTSGSITVSPAVATTYTLTVTNSAGQSAICQAHIQVTQPPPPPPQMPICTITANPTIIQQGQSSTVSWTSTNAIYATLSGIGSVGLSGSITVTPSYATTYTLTVTSATGQSATCAATVNIHTPPPPPPPQNLACTLTITPQGINVGGSAILSWSSTGATSANLGDGFGHVALNGSMVVYPQGSRAYALTVYNAQGRSAVCQAFITLQSQVIPPPPPYYAPPPFGAPYVALAQIPYTGFNAGPLGNAIFWLGLVLFSLAGAYLLLYSRGGIRKMFGVRKLEFRRM